MLIVIKGSVQLPRPRAGVRGQVIERGQEMPADALPEADLERLLAAGILQHAKPKPSFPQAGLPARKGKWCLEPKSLVGKTLEDLRMLAVSIDPQLAESEACLEEYEERELVLLLTADYIPGQALPTPESSDRSRPASDKIRKAQKKAQAE